MFKKLLYFILITLMVVLITLLYSRFIGTTGLKTNEYVIETNIPASYNGLKIIHFSDLHYKKVITETRVIELIEEINLNKPDIVIFTGDLFDKDYTINNTDTNFLIEQLSKINSKYGNYAILGDNDASEKDTISNIYIQSNFTLLDNKAITVHNENNDKIVLYGISTFQNNNNLTTLETNLTSEEQSTYHILLIHEPDYLTSALETLPNINLTLAGHSINGSINIPFLKQLLLPTGAKTYYKPYYQLNQTELYISNGIGVNQINFRLFNTPSINLYRFRKSDA